MKKQLRSRIQEYFPKELRVELELIARQRRPDKGASIHKLLEKYMTQDITPLGPGTNRYAVRLDGYVFKFATDHDGVIDNLKEFKMGDRLYPYVARTYEVSSNGTILVAEYVEPFTSYAEMLMYAEQIRSILKKLSSRYLIGDIGITSKNFVNWGLRVGTNDPVCLDFAYVYDVNSDLFVCKKCKTGHVMLVPDQNFTELICPVCGTKVPFTDIRGRIGNDVHNHEIGDLTAEGYVMLEAVETKELDPERSKYLKQQEEDKMKTKDLKEYDILMKKLADQQEVLPETWSVADVPKPAEVVKPTSIELISVPKPESEEDEEEDDIVFEDNFFSIDEDDDDDEYDEDDESEEDEDDEEKAGLAFSVDISDTLSEAEEAATEFFTNTADVLSDVKDSIKDAVVEEVEKIEKKLPEEIKELPTVVGKVIGVVEDKADEVKEDVEEVVEKITATATEIISKPTESVDKALDPIFLRDENSQRAASKLCKKIADYWATAEIFNANGEKVDVWAAIKPHIHARSGKPGKRSMGKKIESFSHLLSQVQNTLFRTIVDFCGYEQNFDPETQERTWVLKTPNEGAMPTIRWVERFWVDRTINTLNGSELMEKFSELGIGIQPEIRADFCDRLHRFNGLDAMGAELIANWFFDPLVVGQEAVTPEPVLVEVPENAVVTPEELIEQIEPETAVEEAPTDQTPVVEDADADEAEWVDDDGYDDDDEANPDVIVSINDYGNYDKIVLSTFDQDELMRIPFYVNPGLVSNNVSYLADERNGCWEWLAHIMPSEIKREAGSFEPGIRSIDHNGFYTVEIILDDQDGKLLVGVYDDVEIITDREKDAALFDYLNKVIVGEIGSTAVSILPMVVRSFLEEEAEEEEEAGEEIETVDYAAQYMSNYVDDEDDDHRTFQPLHKKRHVSEE